MNPFDYVNDINYGKKNIINKFKKSKRNFGGI